MKVIILCVFLWIPCSFTIKSSHFLNLMKDSITAFSQNRHIEAECISDLGYLIQHSFEMKLWALKMLDSCGKISTGILEGNFHAIGNYDMCLGIKERIYNKNIEGQYCTILLTVDDMLLGSIGQQLKLRNFQNFEFSDERLAILLDYVTVAFGVCIPKSCSVDTLQFISNYTLKRYNVPLILTFVGDLCVHNETRPEVYTPDVFVYVLFALIIFLVIASSIYDVYLRHTDQNSKMCLFSLYTNFPNLFAVSGNNELSCLNGIRVINSAWIIYNHLLVFSVPWSKNPFYIFKEWKYDSINTFFTTFYTLDTFFVLSGLVATYNYLKYSEHHKINLKSFYQVRFIRLIPALAATVFIHLSVLKLFANGPISFAFTKIGTRNCYMSWWRDILFLTNFVSFQKMCVPHLWYLAIDTQFYICAPIILFFIKNHTRKVLRGMALAFVIAATYCFVITIDKNLGYTVYEWSDNYIDYLYLSNFFYLPSWLIGVLCGYLLYIFKTKIPDYLNVTLWIFSVYVMLKLILYQSVFIETEKIRNVWRAALWNAFSKSVWSLALSFVIFSCAIGQGGVVNKFLSCALFKILGRLTYCMYLIHVGVLSVLFINRKETQYFNNLQHMITFWGVYAVVIFCSIIMYLIFEAPIISLRKFSEKQKQKKMD